MKTPQHLTASFNPETGDVVVSVTGRHGVDVIHNGRLLVKAEEDIRDVLWGIAATLLDESSTQKVK